ncbi:uncharacterized protein YALI1_C15947g [Yarrowia lipolytica]|uniref:Uncharacterized protein n=1 Tax=Yarrowia lipolytica TaxID=4952 RepID=A0A1D8NAN6_YARLL|nr:hypothetical protein YALI1_C15947g [Yarrowia lipolytica]
MATVLNLVRHLTQTPQATTPPRSGQYQHKLQFETGKLFAGVNLRHRHLYRPASSRQLVDDLLQPTF